MIVYRLLKKKYLLTPLSAEGALRAGGRWNPAGYPILYTSATPELSLLEVLVHLNPADPRPDLNWIVLELPDPERTVQADELAINWYEPQQYRATQYYLQDWLNQPTYLSVKVPSAIVSLSANYLVHTAYPLFSTQVHLLDIIPCRIDGRLTSLLTPKPL